jgi:hypothetical protein
MKTNLLPLKVLKKNFYQQNFIIDSLIKENNDLYDEIEIFFKNNEISVYIEFDNALFEKGDFLRINDNKLTNIELEFILSNKSIITYHYSINKKNKLVFKYQTKMKNISNKHIDEICKINNEVSNISNVIQEIPKKLLKKLINNVSKNSKIIGEMEKEYEQTKTAIEYFSALSNINRIFVPFQKFSIEQYLYNEFNIDYINNTKKYCNDKLIEILIKKHFKKTFMNIFIHYDIYGSEHFHFQAKVINNKIVYYFDSYISKSTKSSIKNINSTLSNLITFNNQIMYDFSQFPEILNISESATDLNIDINILSNILKKRSNILNIKNF